MSCLIEMRHPSKYSAVPFSGLHVMVVDAGTAITDERSGQTIIVDDDSAVRKGAVLYCTQAIFDALKARVPEG
jgi:hypothetical protein